MIYVIATTYVAESASYAFWKAGYLVYNISNDEVEEIISRDVFIFNFHVLLFRFRHFWTQLLHIVAQYQKYVEFLRLYKLFTYTVESFKL